MPEVAARAHVEAIRSLTHRALAEAGVHPADLDGMAATQGPGLVGSLLVGFSFAKAMAWSGRLPFVGVDHMEGHLMAPLLEHEEFAPPAVALLASGGHSQIVHLADWGRHEVVGATIDDAAGEAFDKVARFLGLGYPGGPAIDLASDDGDPAAVTFPRGLSDHRYNLSFSGLKTSVVSFVRKADAAGDLPSLPDLAASLQEAIVDVLVTKTFNAVDDTGARTVSGGGGVLANRRLRQRFRRGGRCPRCEAPPALTIAVHRQRRHDRRRRSRSSAGGPVHRLGRPSGPRDETGSDRAAVTSASVSTAVIR